MNNYAEEYLNKFLCTSVLGIIKTDIGIPILLENGLLKSKEAVAEVTKRADTIMNINVHK